MQQVFRTIPKLVTELEGSDLARRAVVFAAWTRVAGSEVCKRTLPLEFSDGRLHVATVDDTWRANLRALSPELIARLNGALGSGTVTFIDFTVDKAAGTAALEMDGTAPDLFPVEPGILTAANAIADETLRVTFLEAARQYMFRQGITEKE